MSAVLKSLINPKKTPSNFERLEWLVKRVDYLEHRNKEGIGAQKAKSGGWWPQSEEDESGNQVEELIGLSLIDYIDAMIAAENKTMRFPAVFCSHCGKEFGPGDSGFSHCHDHAHLVGKS